MELLVLMLLCFCLGENRVTIGSERVPTDREIDTEESERDKGIQSGKCKDVEGEKVKERNREKRVKKVQSLNAILITGYD